MKLNLVGIFIVIGVVFFVLALVFSLLHKFGFSKLPGDFIIERENFAFYIPIGTCLLISVILSFVLKYIK